MPIHHSQIDSAVRIIGSVPDKRLVTGERREPIGTGFLVTVPSEQLDGIEHGYVITAAHVIWDQAFVEVQAPRPMSHGAALHKPVRVTSWCEPLPGVDLALAPFPYGNTTDDLFQCLRLEEHVLPSGLLPALGADIYYVGILIPLDRPMVRSGTIGSLDQPGIRHKGGYRYRAHLVDCRSYGGFSGSPCFVEMMYPGLAAQPAAVSAPPDPVGRMHYEALLCGMFAEHLEEAGNEAASLYGVGVMIPAGYIRDALMSDEMREERRQRDVEISTG